MLIGKLFSLIKTKYRHNYIISNTQKKEMTEHNCKMISILSILLMLFGGINCLSVFLTNKTDISSALSLIIYYFGIFFFAFVNFLLNNLCKQHKNWTLETRNIPVYFLFISTLGVQLYIFFNIDKMVNAFAIYACLITISQLLVHIEPVFYSSMILLATIIMTPRMYSLLGLSSVGDLYLYTIIASLFSYNRWKTLKRNYESEKTIKEHAEAIDRELALASNVQQSFYKHKNQEFNNWEIEYYNKPMAGVTGDLFDIYTYNKTLQGLCLFDVSGHGLAAGLVTMLVRNIIRKQFYDTTDKYLEQTMYNIHSEFETSRGKINNYMSGLLFRIVGDKIEFVNAAHPYPFIYRKKENKVKLFEDTNETRGTAIGITYLEPQFFSDFIEISSGDEIVLYTDGITEAKNANREEFGYDRFRKVLQKNINKNLKDQISAIIKEIEDFTGTQKLEDDITILILRRK